MIAGFLMFCGFRYAKTDEAALNHLANLHNVTDMRVRARTGRLDRLDRHVRIAVDLPHIRAANQTPRGRARVLIFPSHRIHIRLDPCS
jgi:hypothetical protein